MKGQRTVEEETERNGDEEDQEMKTVSLQIISPC